jgi:peroxiredoxin Q/BCP
MRMLLFLCVTLGLVTVASVVVKARAEELKPGDPAPPFSLVGSDGKTYTLAAYTGRQAVVLAWFPKAFTGG